MLPAAEERSLNHWTTREVPIIYFKIFLLQWILYCPSHFSHLLKIIKMRSKCETEVKVKVFVSQWCLTLCNSMDCSPPGSSVQGILQASILEWVAIPFSKRPCKFSGSSSEEKNAALTGGEGKAGVMWEQTCFFQEGGICPASDPAPPPSLQTQLPADLLPKVERKLLPHVHSFSCVSSHSAKVTEGLSFSSVCAGCWAHSDR